MHPRIPILLLALALIVPGMALADRGDEREEPRFAKIGDRWLLQNDKISVWFHAHSGKAKPDIVVALKGADGERSGYRVKIVELCEVDATQKCSKQLPRIDLGRARDWHIAKHEKNDSLTLTMTHANAQGIVRIIWHLDNATSAIKYDLQVDDWRWKNASNRLMLDMVILGKNLKNATGHAVSVENSGLVTWEPTAKATYGPNDTRTIPVEGRLVPLHHDDEGEDDDERPRRLTGGHVILLFNATGGYAKLDYDPTFSVMGSSMQRVHVPAAGMAIATVALMAAAIGMRKR